LDKLILTYALIRYCWQEKAEHLDCFWPFTIRILPDDGKYVDLSYIRKQVKSNFELEIPLHTLTVIMQRAEQKQYVSSTSDRYPLKRRYRLTGKGKTYIHTIEIEPEVERRMHALFIDIKNYLNKEFEQSVSENNISTGLLAFILKNIEPLVEFFNPNATPRKSIGSNRRFSPLGHHLAKYIELAEREKPEHYSTLRDILFGAVLSTILNAQDISKVTQRKAYRFKNCNLFLDTNFIFSMFGLHERAFNDAAEELVKLIKDHNITMKVFSFTTDELCRVMNGYLTEGDKYPASINIANSIYSNLKRKKWTKTDVKAFIMSVDKRLQEKGISIETVVDIDLNTYQANETIRSSIARYKRNQSTFSQNHDLAAIEKIKAMRKHQVRRLEHAKVLFLTSDRGLSAFNFTDMSHKANGTIAEVILDSLLANIIWLSDPSANISLKSIIAAHSRGLFIKREVWLKFYDALKKVRLEDKADDQDISTLFYGDFIEDELRTFDESRLEAIDEKFVLDKIDKAKQLIKEEQEKKEAEFLKRLAEERSKAEQEKEQQFYDKLEMTRKKLRRASDKTGTRISIAFSALLTILLIGALIAACWFLWEKVQIQWLIQSILVIINGLSIWGLTTIWLKFRQYCKSQLGLWHYAKKIKEFDLTSDNSISAMTIEQKLD
jgi:hypothetical protein